jgi:hypothetical protein
MDHEKEGGPRRSISHENLSSSKSERSSEREAEIHDEKHDEPTNDPEHDMMADLEKHLSRKSTRKNRLEPEIYPLMDLENGLVGWDSQDDPINPRSATFAHQNGFSNEKQELCRTQKVGSHSPHQRHHVSESPSLIHLRPWDRLRASRIP